MVRLRKNGAGFFCMNCCKLIVTSKGSSSPLQNLHLVCFQPDSSGCPHDRSFEKPSTDCINAQIMHFYTNTIEKMQLQNFKASLDADL